MKKISLAIALMLICTAVFSACGSSGGIDVGGDKTSSTEAQTEEAGNTVTGLDGTKVTIPESVSTVAVASDAVAAVMDKLGVSAVTVGEDGDVSGLGADVIFADEDVTVTGAGDTPVLVVPLAETVNDIKSMIRLVAQVTDKTDAGEEIIDKMTSTMDVTQGISNNYIKKVSAFIDLGDFNTAGTGTYVYEMLSAAGDKSIYQEEGYGTVTAEDIIAANPEMIFTVGSADDFYNDPAFAELDAVVNNRVYELDADSVLIASQNVTDAVEVMSEATSNYVSGTSN
jgi:ABC-type Fe3+-hydroxamate transport system substrate-binding protein